MVLLVMASWILLGMLGLLNKLSDWDGFDAYMAKVHLKAEKGLSHTYKIFVYVAYALKIFVRAVLWGPFTLSSGYKAYV
jgi:hypothetical protein